MRYTPLLALALAGCGAPPSGNEAENSANPQNGLATGNLSTPEPASQNANAADVLPAPGSSALADDVIVSTNEPFWSARIGEKHMILTGAGEPERRLAVIASNITAEGRVIRARDGGGSVEAVVRDRPCQDSMSGARFLLSGSLNIEGRGKADGCARLASAPPPAIPGEEASDEPRAATIPARFTGRWGVDRAACRNPASSIEGLTISPRELRFHESLGVPRKVERRDADTIAVTSAYEGEGQQWTATQTLRLDSGGDRLTVIQDANRFSRIRC